MTIKYDGRNLLKRYYNGQEVQKVMYDGHQIRPDVTPPTADYLCFTGTAGSSIALSKIGTPNVVYLEVSYDGTTWSDYTFGVQINYDSNINKVYFRNKSTTTTYFSKTYNDYYQFYMSGSISASGDITTLLCKDGTTTLTSDYCFYRLFENCTALTAPPDLPATTLTKSCYQYMFRGCTSLVNAPTLPSTSMAGACYMNMFSGCTSLVTAPTLPATTLDINCYNMMFFGCTSLVNVPNLPATTLAESCYSGMFRNCTSLVNTPTLSATTLAEDCYYYMFRGCTSLVTLPILSATILEDSSYMSMFADCSKIKLSTTQTGEYQIPYRIPTTGTGVKRSNSLSGMFSNTGGTFTGTPAINTEYYLSTDNDIVGDFDYLCFTANTGGSTIQFNGDSSHNINMPQLQYSYDKESWTDYYCDSYGTSEIVTLTNVGDKVYFRNKSKTIVCYNTYYYENTFTLTGSISASGDVGFILCRYSTNVMPDYCFKHLFSGGALTTAPRLPATTLGSQCYYYMFNNCASLTVAPELPATTLASKCYVGMFQYCSSLIVPPELPATTLAVGCYNSMFGSCHSLTTLPNLPATTLTDECYYRMFHGCSNIKLSETQTGDYQTPYMIPTNGGGTIGTNSMYEMFKYTGGTRPTPPDYSSWKGTPSINTTYYTSNTVI